MQDLIQTEPLGKILKVCLSLYMRVNITRTCNAKFPFHILHPVRFFEVYLDIYH